MEASELKEGMVVSVSGDPGFTIQKVLKQTVKVEKGGKTFTKPICMVELDAENVPVPDYAEGAKKAAEAKAQEEPKKGGRRRKVVVPVKPKPEEPRKGGRRKKETPAPYIGEPETPDSDAAEAQAKDDAENIGKKETKRYETVQDQVTKVLGKCESATAIEKAMRGHKAFDLVNSESFKNLIKQKKTLQLGLFRMRAGNLLRGAIRRKGKK